MPAAGPVGKCPVTSESPARRLAALFTVCSGLAGCLGSDRVTSTGTVTFDGRPVDSGAIVFVPLEAAVAPEGAAIASGRFTVVGRRGRRRVQIRGTRPVSPERLPRTMARFDGLPVNEDYIPATYNTASTLEIEVTEGPNVFTFDLKSP